MAKILTGPLAAGISGKLGPVVFHQTKFGQTVQSKAKPRTYTTGPAMATKAAFRAGASGVAMLGGGVFWNLQQAFAREGKSGHGQFVSQVSAGIRGEDRNPLVVGGASVFTLGAITEPVPGQWQCAATVALSAGFAEVFAISWFQLDANSRSLRRIAGQFLPATNRITAPPGSIEPPFFCVAMATSFNPTGQSGDPFRASISNVRYQPT